MASKNRTQNRLRMPDDIVALIRGCHPQLERKISAGLRYIVTEPEVGKSLKDDLVSLKSYRVSRFRIIYRISPKHIIEIAVIGPRNTIYEETYRIIKKETKI